MQSVDLEKINRENFKTLMRVLSYPAKKEKIQSIFSSNLLAISSVLLYSEVKYFYEGVEDMEIIKAITNAKKTSSKEADYIFCDGIDMDILKDAKIGTFKDPDFSATIIYKCKNFDGLDVKLTGVGIEKEKRITLPVTKEFIDIFMQKNKEFPLGLEVFFLSDDGEVVALSRTTKVEII